MELPDTCGMSVKSLNNLKNEHPLKTQLADSCTDAINWLQTLQSLDGGFGRKRGDNPTIVHTAIAIKALLTNDSTESKKAIKKAMKWILKNKKSSSIDKIDVEDVFDEYDQIMFIGEDIRRRVILHENFLEGILLNSLIEADENGCTDKLNFIDKYHFMKVIEIVVDELLKKQIETGKLQGAFKSRRSAHAEQCPIYATCFAVSGLQSLKRNLKNIFKKPSLMTLSGLGIIVFTIILLTTMIISWVMDLSLGKAVGLFFCEIVICVIGSLIVTHRNSPFFA